MHEHVHDNVQSDVQRPVDRYADGHVYRSVSLPPIMHGIRAFVCVGFTYAVTNRCVHACILALTYHCVQQHNVPCAVEGAEVGHARQPAAVEIRIAPGYVARAAVRTVQVMPGETRKHLGVWLGQPDAVERSLQAKCSEAIPGSGTLGAERAPARNASTAFNTLSFMSQLHGY